MSALRGRRKRLRSSGNIRVACQVSVKIRRPGARLPEEIAGRIREVETISATARCASSVQKRGGENTAMPILQPDAEDGSAIVPPEGSLRDGARVKATPSRRTARQNQSDDQPRSSLLQWFKSSDWRGGVIRGGSDEAACVPKLEVESDGKSDVVPDVE
ncbi:unnamed protein product, partial [Discosporangium mesarthrocarpum]